jgi:hypothetical protein
VKLFLYFGLIGLKTIAPPFYRDNNQSASGGVLLSIPDKIRLPEAASKLLNTG